MLDPEKDIIELERWQAGLKNEFEERNNEEIPKPETCKNALNIIKFFQEIGGVLKYARASADLTICMLFEMAEKEMRLECDDEGCGVQTPHNSFYDLILK